MCEMLNVLVLILLTVSPVHTQTGFHKFGGNVGCDEINSDYSLTFNEENVLYYNYKQNKIVMELPDFAEAVEFPDRAGEALGEEKFCKHLLAVLTEAYMNPPEELEPPRSSIYPKSDMKLKTESTLICHVANFFPPPVSVFWTKNDLNVTEGVTESLYYHNSDGTLSVFSMLNFTAEEGDIYSCVVNHRALENPLTKIWDVDVQVDQPSVFPTVMCVVGVCFGIFGAVAGIFLIIRANSLCN